RIVSASWDGTLRLWDLHTGETLHNLRGHRTAVRDCAFSPDGTMILSVSNDRTVKVWNIQTGRWLSTLHVDGELLGCAWHPD
ncbi:hypothetical protein RSW84_28790, partial [Escherichia coli]|uniref:WD40 repeat domain-containing protein n=1 Tax=Escherichia coli TaxID=562 RepID=UPI0028DFC4EB